jgi:hypothetical protein
VHEYEFDAALAKEMREHAKQAAQELGQLTDRHEHTGKDGSPLETVIVYLPSKRDEQPVPPVALPEKKSDGEQRD